MQQNQNETKAVVHRSDLIPGGKTLDSDAIKQYQNIKQNTAAVSGKQQRYSGMFSEKTQSQPIRDEYCFVSTNQKTGERSKERQNLSSSTSSREHLGHSIYKQNSFDNLTRNTDTLSRYRDKYEAIQQQQQQQHGSDNQSPMFVPPELKKQDSFEGHEAAVRSLVEAVHESRKLEAKQRKKSEG